MKGRILSLPFSLICLCAAILLYGVASSPTPDDPGIVELLIGFFLIMAAAGGALRRLGDFERSESAYLKSLHIFLLVGLSLPLIIGVVGGNDWVLIGRDVLAFLFLCLPLFVLEALDRRPEAGKVLPWLYVFVGAVFAMRTLVPAFHVWIAPDELLYLSNSPLVLFAAIFLCGQLWRLALRSPSWRNAGKAAVMAAGIVLILAAMLLDVQRATVAAIALSFAVFWVGALVKTPRRIVVPTILLVLLIGLFWPWLSGAGEAIYAKTAAVGLNMRMQELEAVWLTLQENPWRFFTGTGWGGAYVSPAVGEVRVNYTHSLLTSLFLKGGAIFLFLGLCVCAAAIYQIILIFQRDSVRGLSLFWPFLIPVLLYASHKSFDFGLLLLLIGVWSNPPHALHKQGR